LITAVITIRKLPEIDILEKEVAQQFKQAYKIDNLLPLAVTKRLIYGVAN